MKVLLYRISGDGGGYKEQLTEEKELYHLLGENITWLIVL